MALVATNLAPKPSFEIAGSSYAARTNLLRNPRLDNLTTYWTTAGGSVQTAQAGGSLVDVPVSASSDSWTLYSSGATTITGAGNPYVAAATLSVPVGQPAFNARIAVYLQGLTITVMGEPVLIGPGETATLTAGPAVSAAGNVGQNATILIMSASPVPVATKYTLTNAILEQAPIYTGYFDGTTTSTSDITYSWTGTANLSSSIATVSRIQSPMDEGVSGGTTVIGCQSALWASSGTKSLRIIPRSPSTDTETFVYLAPGAMLVAGKYYTMMAKSYLPAPISGPLGSKFRAFGYYDSFTPLAVDQGPNTAGIFQHRVTFQYSSSGNPLFFFNHGGTANSGDIFWDEFLLVEVPSLSAPYTGPYFDGNTPDVGGVTHGWTGSVNNSTSTRSSVTIGEQTIPEPYGSAAADNSKGYMTVTYRSGWLG